MSVEEAPKIWSLELTNIRKNLIGARQEIQSSFASLNSKSGHVAEAVAVADPIQILRRIDALESTIQELNGECQDCMRRRPVLAQEVTSLLLQNFRDIEELTVLTKGRQASLDPTLKRLAISTHGENKSWERLIQSDNHAVAEEAEADNVDEREKEFHTTTTNDEHCNHHSYGINRYAASIDGKDTSINDSTSMSAEADINGTSYIDDETGGITITPEQFRSIPIERRGRCKLDHIQKVGSFIYEEVSSRYLDGYRGKNLSVERQQIAKYSGGYPGLYDVIMNHNSLWRDIISALQFLGFVTIDNDGTLMMTGIQ